MSLPGRMASWNQLLVRRSGSGKRVLPVSLSGRTASWNRLPVGRLTFRVEDAT